MDENSFDSGHVVLPVAHPSGETHNIAVPPDTDLGDLHAALTDAGYEHPALTGKTPQPTAAGAIENSKEFKDNAQKLWNEAQNGKDRGEVGNFVTSQGSYTSPLKTPGREDGGGRITFPGKPENSMAVIHTHPHVGGLSPQDIQTAKDNHLVVYAIDADGLHAVGPDGKVTQVYGLGDMLHEDKPKKVWVPKYNKEGHRIN